MNSQNELIRFIEKSTALDNNSKLKAILLITGVKPSTFVHLRIQKNLHDKHEFEELLHANKILYETSKPKGYEEITDIKGNTVKWKISGMWYGYDLFSTKQYNQRFLEYIELIKQGKHEQADKLAGKIYGYPDCCIKNFIKEHNPTKKYTYYQYYKKLHDMDKAFPYITHTPCSLKCKPTQKLNKQYEKTIKKWAPTFYKQYNKATTHKMPIIVDLESKIPGLKWKQDGHDYTIITTKPINEKYYMISWLTKAKFDRGTILDAQITLKHDYATIKINKKIGKLDNLHHERKFTRL